METAMSVNHLVHSFGERRAVDDLTFEVGRGEVFGLLGPNGAGKTTTVRLLNGLYRPSGGEMRILGLDPAARGQEVRARTGVLTETPALYERLTAYQNLEFFGRLADMKPADLKLRITELLAFFELENRANDKAGTYSKGMKQRLALARALLTRPEVVFLDEPTSGLDPEILPAGARTDRYDPPQRRAHRLSVHSPAQRGRAPVRPGGDPQQRAAAGPRQSRRAQPAHLAGLMGGGRVLAAAAAPPRTAWFAGCPGGRLRRRMRVRFQVLEESAIPGVVTVLVQAGAKLTRLQPEQITLEDVYFKLQEQSRQGVK